MTRTNINPKKLVAAIMAMLMLIALLPATAFAAGGSMTLEVESVKAQLKAGNTVKVPIKATANTGYGFGSVKVKWDKTALELTGVTYTALAPASVWVDEEGESGPAPITNNGEYTIAFGDELKGNGSENNPKNFTGTGVFFTLEFKITSAAKAGDYTIGLSDFDVYDAVNVDPLTVTGKDGKVTLTNEPVGYTVTLDNKTQGKATVSGIVSGNNYSGNTTFTVSCDKACAVAYSTDGGATYTRLTAVADGGKYKFTVNVTQNTVIAIVLKGDTNLDGDVKNQDYTGLKAANAGKRTLTALQILAGDINGKDGITNQDVTRLKASIAGKTTLTWDI